MSDEFTTDMLKAMVDNDLSQGAPDWNQGVTMVPCPTNHFITGSASTSAYRNLSSDQTDLKAGRMDYHVVIPDSDPCTTYNITWQKQTVTATTTNLSTDSESLTGNGSTLTGSNYVVMPPSDNGSVSLLGIQIIPQPNNSCVASAADGGGGGSTCCGGGGGGTALAGSTKAWLQSMHQSFALGGAGYKRSAGDLVLAADTPSANLTNPATLAYVGDASLVTIGCTAAGVITNVDAPQCRATVVPQTSGYDIQFFAYVGNQYTNNAFVTYSIRNPNGANTVQIIEHRGGRVITNEFSYLGTSTTYAWQLTQGNGLRGFGMSATTNNGLITIARSIFTPATGFTNARSVELWQPFPWGLGLLSHTLDPGGLNLVTSNTYDPTNRLTLSVRPDGSWNSYVYDASGRVTTACSAFNNEGPGSASCRKVTYNYTSLGSPDVSNVQPFSPRTTTETIAGNPIRTTKNYYAADGSVVTILQPGSGGGTISLVTTNRHYTTAPFFNEPMATDNPDKTRLSYLYDETPNGRTVTQLSGQAASGSLTGVTDGIQTVTTYGPTGKLLSRLTYDIISTFLLSSETYAYDEEGRATSVTYLDGTSTVSAYQDCCNASTVVDRDGATVSYQYDDLRRLVSVARLGVTKTVQYLTSTNRVVTSRTGNNGTNLLMNDVTYDAAARPVLSYDALNHLTTTTYTTNTAGSQIRTTTRYNDAGAAVTTIETVARDGSLLSSTGSGVHGRTYAYGVENNELYTIETKLDANGGSTSETNKTYTDFAGRPYKTVYPGATSQTYYNGLGQEARQVDPDGVTRLFEYNARGERVRTATSATQGTTIDPTQDRLTATFSFVTSNAAHGSVRVSQTYIWPTNGSATSNLVSSVETSTEGLRAWQSAYGLTNFTASTLPSANGTRYSTNTAPDGSYSATVSQYGRVLSVARFDANNTQLSQATYGYDPFGRQATITDARTGTSTVVYDALDRVATNISVAPGPGQSPQITIYTRDPLGRVTQVTQPDNTTVQTTYFDTGEPRKKWGSREYPVEYTYDYDGRVKTMTTWQNYANSQGAAITTWNYDTTRGFLLNKRYHDNTGHTYTHTAAGRLYSRTWARGTNTTYITNAFGETATITYSDGSPSVQNYFDRLGHVTAVTNGQNGIARVYDLAGTLLSETVNGLIVTNQLDSLNRRTGLSFSSQVSSLSLSFGYDPASRLSGVTNGASSATYSYLANSPLVEQITFRDGTTTRMTTTKTYDNLNRLTRISSVPSASSVVSFDYGYNDANQRTTITVGPDHSYWAFTYDSLGQVTSGKKYWPDGTSVAGQQFEYAFDDIGNRNQTKTGGDASGSNLRVAGYTNNLLNQITGRAVPAAVEIVGIAHASASVTVNGETAYRKGEYYRQEVSLSNLTNAVFTAITNAAVLAGATAQTIGNLLTPPRAQQFWHDPDGNLLSDGVWTNTWNAENRLISTETMSGVPSQAQAKESWSYYADGRWAERVVFSRSGTNWVAQSTNRFIWDRLLLLAILDHTNGLVQAFMRGLDLSGSMQGAGGAGGLLAMIAATNGNHFYSFDGNGNVVALISATNGAETARYEYGPFAEPIRMTGPMAKLNTMRFSSQFKDDVKGDVRYLYRDYTPSSGRWLSKDPLNEHGGKNAYCFVFNDSIGRHDKLGLVTFDPSKGCTKPACQAAADSIMKGSNYHDSVIAALTDYLRGQNCAFDFACFQGDECGKQKPPMVSGGDAVFPTDYGPGKGKCTVRICGQKTWNLTQSLRHELAHCKRACSGKMNNSCEAALCHELYASFADLHCNDINDESKFRQCLRDSAKASLGLTHQCDGKDMDNIMTDAFVDNCIYGN